MSQASNAYSAISNCAMNLAVSYEINSGMILVWRPLANYAGTLINTRLGMYITANIAALAPAGTQVGIAIDAKEAIYAQVVKQVHSVVMQIKNKE
jgi:hypothetical protein